MRSQANDIPAWPQTLPIYSLTIHDPISHYLRPSHTHLDSTSDDNTMSSSGNQTNSLSSGSYSSVSYSSASYSSSSSSDPTGHSATFTQMTSSNDRDGTTVRRTAHETGQPDFDETRHYPTQGGQTTIEGGQGGGNDAARVQDVTDEDPEQAARDREYEERMEDEYAKREGGA
ncbi:hypothetical protein, variant [Exophiala mesophila]|uniref:Uncharacterized protein n=1 Tax=Exophiala mesophila TaxID=212818 RepID=A0A0D1WKM5_EXOME|nr:hypothetical protein, variant [Exophiala mesophila]KIV89490.1 hypothetical protein, variant [Exophiala mesophila]